MALVFVNSEIAHNVSRDQREFLFANLLRDPELFDLAENKLLPEHLDLGTELPLMILWGAARNIAKANGSGFLSDPTQARMWIEVEARSFIDNNPETAVPEIYQTLCGEGGLLDWIFGLKPEELNAVQARAPLQVFD